MWCAGRWSGRASGRRAYRRSGRMPLVRCGKPSSRMRPLPEAFFQHGDTARLRRAAARCLEAALQAADPRAAVRRALTLDGHWLAGFGGAAGPDHFFGIFVVGGGKAGAAMAAALEEVLGDRINAGVVSVKYGHTAPTSRVRVVEAGHPLPDAASVAAAEEVLAMARRAGERDLVFVLISGGGSALLTAPPAPRGRPRAAPPAPGRYPPERQPPRPPPPARRRRANRRAQYRPEAPLPNQRRSPGPSLRPSTVHRPHPVRCLRYSPGRHR